METSRSECAINIKKLSDSTMQESYVLRPLSSECCIYKVDQRMRRSNEHLYTPKVVSIGPIHHGKPELREMEEHKKRYLANFVKYMEVSSLEEYFEHIEKNEMRLRDCYAHVVELNSEDFVKMVLVDAVFVLMELLDSAGCYVGPFSWVNIGISRSILEEIRFDMVLLENQLPFFILVDLYELSKMHDYIVSQSNPYLSERFRNMDEGTSFISLSYHFLQVSQIVPTITDSEIFIQVEAVEHLLALMRHSVVAEHFIMGPQPHCIVRYINIPSVKDLQQAGLKFQAGSKDNMLDIKFKDGVLEIPPLSIGQDTEILFRNLQAFEVSHGLQSLCCDYFIMMHRLTIASADVECLIENKIIENRLSNIQEVSAVFHNLLHGCYIDRDNFRYAKVMDGLNAYYGVRWNKWKATLIQKYFKAPWAVFSFIAAILLLVLTIVQTVCSILQVT